MGVSTPTILAYEVKEGNFYNVGGTPEECAKYKNSTFQYNACLADGDPALGKVENRPSGIGYGLTTIATEANDKPKRDWGQTLQNVGSGLGSLLSGFQTGQQSGGLFGGSATSNIQFIQAQQEAERRRRRNATIGVVIGIGVVGAIGYGIYKSAK